MLLYIVQFKKIFILPSQKGLEFPGGWGTGIWKIKKYKEMYEAFLKFPEGWGGVRWGGGGGMDIFWNYTLYLVYLPVTCPCHAK